MLTRSIGISLAHIIATLTYLIVMFNLNVSFIHMYEEGSLLTG